MFFTMYTVFLSTEFFTTVLGKLFKFVLVYQSRKDYVYIWNRSKRIGTLRSPIPGDDMKECKVKDDCSVSIIQSQEVSLPYSN